MMQWASILLLGLMLSSTMHANTATLIVTLHDAADRPIAGATVMLRDMTGTTTLAQQTTDVQGHATFDHLPIRDVRAAIVGQAPSGAPFSAAGNDAHGFLVLLQAGTMTVDILADDTGVLVLDPRTMWALEPAVPLATTPVYPTPPLPAASPRLAPQRGAVSNGQQAPVVQSNVSPVRSIETAPDPAPFTLVLGLVLLLGLLATSMGILVLMRRWR